MAPTTRWSWEWCSTSRKTTSVSRCSAVCCDQGGRPGQAHRKDRRGAGRRRPARPRGKRPRRAHRRWQTARHQRLPNGRNQGSGHRGAQVRTRADADRAQGHRRDDSHRPRPARAHHRRPPAPARPPVAIDTILNQKDTDVHCFYVGHWPEAVHHRGSIVDQAQESGRDGVHHGCRRRRHPSPHRCSSSRPTPASRWPSTTATTASTPSSFTTICPSKP